ncbi:hypothetical protein L6452_01936 [Arctium lappa]|uniref:Uncharacterized protein n=1 Tax=Arctium lappa TaxID=4217 RepID=A0ACB9FI04_ARCLA|nr:hypothetical protein L6452_01936 [Arctium lappa]
MKLSPVLRSVLEMVTGIIFGGRVGIWILMEEQTKGKKMSSSSGRQLKAMLRKNWLLKIRHPYITLAESVECVLWVFLIIFVLNLLSFERIPVRTQVDTKIHPAESKGTSQGLITQEPQGTDSVTVISE